MLRYPDSNLNGKIVDAHLHPTITTSTILRVCIEDNTSEEIIHILDNVLPPEDLVGLCIRADALYFPPARKHNAREKSLLAMEWCLHKPGGEIVKCSPGWTDVETTQTIEIKPEQI